MKSITADDFRCSGMRGFGFFETGKPLPAAEHFSALASTGANHARVWLNVHWVSGSYVVRPDDISRLCDGLARLQGLGLYAVVAVSADVQPWGSPSAMAAFASVSGQVARIVQPFPAVAAIDMLNEPVPSVMGNGDHYSLDDQAMIANKWRRLAADSIAAIRAADPGRCVVYQVGLGADPNQFTGPELLADNVVYSAHLYHPHAVTHQSVSAWNEGRPRDPARPFDSSAMATMLASVRRVAAAMPDSPVYLGEVGCVNWTPDSGAAAYLETALRECLAAGMSFSVHEWRGWPGWDYEADPDGWFPNYTRSASAPAICAITAAMRRTQEQPMADPTPTPAPAPDAPLQPIPTDPALLAEIKSDNAQDEKLGRDAIAAADVRVARLGESLAAALIRESQFVSDCLIAMSGAKDLSAADAEARARGLLQVRRKLLAELDGGAVVQPTPPTPADPLPPAATAPATLSANQALRYLQTFGTEFKAAGILTAADAAKHWQRFGRAEWLAGDPNRRRFTP